MHRNTKLKKMKNLLRIGSTLLILTLAVAGVQAQKFGFLNTAAILAEMPEVKQAEANLEAFQKQLQKQGQAEVEKLRKEYQTVQQKIERGELSPKQQEEEAAKLQAKEQELAQMEQDMMAQIQKKRNDSLQPIYDKLNQAIKEVAQENGMQFIFDQAVLLYFDPSADVSDKVKAKLGL